MIRHLIPAALVVGLASSASAHFPFLVPDGDSKGKAVFSDTLKPDTQGVPVDRIANTKLILIEDGKASDLTWTLDKAANCYTFEVPGTGPRMVVGTTDYGVLQRGDSKPFLLRYYSKALFGGLPAPEKATAGDKVPVELVPVVAGGKLRFKVLSSGKPLARSAVSVLVPGETKSKDVTSDDGGLTPEFDTAGTYAVQVRLSREMAGEHDGKKYAEVRDYATLVVTFAGK